MLGPQHQNRSVLAAVRDGPIALHVPASWAAPATVRGYLISGHTLTRACWLRLLPIALAALLGGCSEGEGPARAEPAAGDSADAAASAFSSDFEAYEWLHGALSESGPVPQVVDAVATLMPDQRRAHELAELLSEHLRAGLYRRLITAPPSADVLFGWVETELDATLAQADELQTTRGATYAWRSSYALEAALLGYEVTGQERFLIEARDAMLEMLEHRDERYGRVDDYRGRVLKAWGTDHLDHDGEFVNVVTHAGRIATPMAWYAWIIDRDEQLRASHQRAAETLLDAAMAAVAEFDDDFRVADDGSYGYYWRAIDGRIEALNHQTSVGEALLYIAALTGEDGWKRRAEQVTDFIREVMFEQDNGTVAWRYEPTPQDPEGSPPEAIWKSQITIRFLRHAERLNVGFDARDLAEVARSFRVNVLREDGYNAHFAAEHEPLDEHEHHFGGPINLTPHLILGEYDQELHDELVEIVATDPDVGGWFAHGKTVIAYAYLLGHPDPLP
jgi:hypothetical protein